jgi:hypothetical protein
LKSRFEPQRRDFCAWQGGKGEGIAQLFRAFANEAQGQKIKLSEASEISDRLLVFEGIAGGVRAPVSCPRVHGTKRSVICGQQGNLPEERQGFLIVVVNASFRGRHAKKHN